MVRKATQNYIVFLSLLVLGMIEVVSGFVLWFALPRGTGRFGAGAEFWSLARHTWVDIHNWVALIIVAAVMIHVILHWKWIFYTTKKIFRDKRLTVGS